MCRSFARTRRASFEHAQFLRQTTQLWVALLMSLEIEKVESELIKLFPDLEAEYTAGEVMAALEPYLEDGRIALDDSSGHVKVYNIYLVSYEWVGINW